MKKTLYLLLVALLVIELTACSTSVATMTPTIVDTAEPAAIVKFSDPVLEALIRGAMGKLEGDITVTDAEAVTWLNLNNEWQRYISEETQIKDISGLENFINLERLDLSFHEVTDVSPLAGLTKLTSLSLGGNPVADISPLASLTNLKVLILSNCAAQDYSPLVELINLEYLMLDNSTISDISPLASLTNLRHVYLADSPVIDYFPLASIYPNLEGRDFTIASTLKELGFSLDYGTHEAYFESENASFTINHAAWGPPSREDNVDIIRISTYLESGYKVSVGYYGVHKVYVCQMDKEGQPQVNYVYDIDEGSNNLEVSDHPDVEAAIRAAMPVEEGEDPLLAPVRFFSETLKNTFNMTAEKLFAMPFEPPTLKSLGFFPDEANAVYLYEYRGEKDVNMEVHRPEWGEKEYDVQFFTPLSDEYRVNVTYYVADKKFYVKADDNDQGGASYEFFIDTGEHIDEWCSDPDKTVEEYFIKAYNDPAIEDIYQHSVELMVQYITDTFGMTVEELYALPTGE